MTTALTVGIESKAALVVGNNPFSKAIVADWIAFCDVKPATQATYNKAIENFAAYLMNNNISTPTRQDVIGYRDNLLALDYKVSSVRLYMTICKKFFRWLSSKMIYPNVAEGVKLPAMPNDEHARDSLTLSEAKATISSFKGTSEKELRDRAIMSLMIGCGLRSIEIIRLDVGDIEKRRGQWFIRVYGKARAGKTDSGPLSQSLKKILDDYLKSRAVVRKREPMFISTSRRNRGARLETQSVSRLAKRVFKTIGIESERITCHSCRHTAATLMLQAGVAIRQVQRILRHRSACTTEIYSHDLDAFNNKGVEILSNLLF
ncbi:MAG: tyrosine-type recombinase/integrase [Selenomonadaceae bacterium]|nr:tyrosine-type recombinase/integrase [Selenomonadaceae bacterium]